MPPPPRFDEITLDDIATFPRPGMAVPGGLGFTPDSRLLTFLWSEEGSLARSLYALDPATGERDLLAAAPAGTESEEGLSREVELRRERARLRETGITSYAFAREADPAVLLVPVRGRLFVRRGEGHLEEVAGTEDAVDGRLSRDGTLAGFVREGDLHVADLSAGEVRRLTSDAELGLTNGVAEFIAHEELGRPEGFWISPDGARIAFARADERHVPVYPIVHQGKGSVEVEEHRYPFAGAENARVRLGVVPAAGGPPTFLDLGPGEDVYLARVAWRPDGTLAAALLTRDQTRLDWLVCDPATGRSSPLFSLEGDPWLNLDRATRFLETGETLYSSEETGFRHLHLRAPDGATRALTSGEWVVTRLVSLDEELRVAYFEGTRESVLERHVYAVPLDGGEVRRLSTEPGWHEATFSPDHRCWADRWSSLEHAPRIVLRETDGDGAVVVHDDPEATAERMGLAPPRLFTFPAEDGTPLHAAVYEQPGGTGEPRPLLVSVYGGPHAQRVANEWGLTGVDLRAQLLAQRGFRVLRVDNRGAANRGLAFEAALHLRFGTVEVEDQVAGILALAEQVPVDLTRVGVYGWSYGGYMTLMCMARRPDVFRYGIAGAPVTDWDGYDTGYTERYMGTPASNPEGYREGSALTHAGKIEGDLLLVHGMVDENVHFRHTARLLAALAKAGRTAELLVLPEERHMPRDKSGLLHLETRLLEFVERAAGSQRTR